MKRFLLLTLIAAAALAQDPAPALPDSLRIQLALDQRDYLIAKATYDSASQKLAQTAKEARAICEKGGGILNDNTVACVAKPAKETAPAVK